MNGKVYEYDAVIQSFAVGKGGSGAFYQIQGMRLDIANRICKPSERPIHYPKRASETINPKLVMMKLFLKGDSHNL